MIALFYIAGIDADQKDVLNIFIDWSLTYEVVIDVLILIEYIFIFILIGDCPASGVRLRSRRLTKAVVFCRCSIAGEFFPAVGVALVHFHFLIVAMEIIAVNGGDTDD